MGGDGSAFAALGLEPGADRAAVESAYRRLIKDHHPDRAGGDAARAAEINRAYRELRDERLSRDDLVFNEPTARTHAHMQGPWLAVTLMLALASLALLLVIGRGTPLVDHGLGSAGALARSGGKLSEPMLQPISAAAVDAGAVEAIGLARSGDEMALTDASRACHQQFRAEPSLDRLDRCAAFDDAVVWLQDRDPMRDRGPFSELAVTGRQWSAAKALSGDVVAIDGRLRQVRLRVELLLAGSVTQRS